MGYAYTRISDEELNSYFFAIKTGNQPVIEQFVQKTQSRAIYWAFSFLRNLQDAEDVVQETYLALLKRVQDTDDPETINVAAVFWFYLYCRCKTRCKDMQNKKTREVEYECNTSHMVVEKPEFLPEDALESGEKSAAILKAMNELPDEQRRAALSVYVADIPIQETATILGKSVGTIKSQLFMARRKLQHAAGLEEAAGRKLHSLVGASVLMRIFEQDALAYGYTLPADALGKVLLAAMGTAVQTATGAAAVAGETAAATTAAATAAETATAATAATATAETAIAAAATTATATTAVAATTAAAGVTATTTILTGVGVMAKFAALAVSAKVAIVTGAVVVAAAGVGVPVYVHGETVKAEQAAIVEQQRVEQVQAEAAAQEAADRIAAEQVKAAEEKAATEKAEKAAAEKKAAAEAEQQRAAEQAEAEKAAQAATAAAQAQAAAADASSTAAAQPSRTEGSKKDSAANQPGYVPTDDPSGGLGGGGSADAPLQETTPKGEGSKQDAATGPMTNGGATGEVTQAERDQFAQDNIDRKGAPWRGQSEPEKSDDVKTLIRRSGGGSWDSSIGGWDCGKNVVFPDGTFVGR